MTNDVLTYDLHNLLDERYFHSKLSDIERF